METTAKAWQCELEDCGRIWLARDSVPPRICPGCKKTGWHKTASTRELVRESTLDKRIRETVKSILDNQIRETVETVLSKLRESAPNLASNSARLGGPPVGAPSAPASVAGWTETVPPSPLAFLPVEDRRAAVLASVAGLGVTHCRTEPQELRATVPVPLVADPAEPPAPCPYTEPDYETGYIHGCPLRLGHKGKHVRGPKVGDIY